MNSGRSLQKRVRNKLLFALLFLTLIPLLVWASLVYQRSLRDHTVWFEHQLQQSAHLITVQGQNWFRSNQILLNFLVREVGNGTPRKEWSRILQNLVLSEPNIYVAHVSNPQGVQLARSDGREAVSIADRDYFQRALRGEFTSEPVMGKVYRRPTLCSAGPIYIDGHVRYVASFCSLLAEMSVDIGAIRIGKTGRAFLIDDKARVLAHPETDFLSEAQFEGEKALVQKAVHGATGRIEYREDDKDYVAFIYKLPNGWKALALQSKNELQLLARKTMAWPLTIGSAVLLLLFLLTSVFIDRITSPLHRLTEAVQRFGQGDLEVRAKVESRDELGVLAHNFNLMAKQIRAKIQELRGKERLLARHRDELHQKVIEQSQKLLYSSKMSSLGEMAGGIAHEINNPLAIISLKAQHLQSGLSSGRMTPPEATQAIEQIEKTCLRINQIVRGLRAFSRDGSRDPMVPENLSSILSDTENLCSESLRARGIQLSIHCPPEIFLVCQPIQISQVFLNLIMNSRDALARLNEKWIRIDCSQTDQNVLIRLTDSGIGIPEPTRSQMMQPFYTTKGVGEGTGLGLSICKGIVEHHGGELVYNADHEHTQFLIRLPVDQRKMKTPSRGGRYEPRSSSAEI